MSGTIVLTGATGGLAKSYVRQIVKANPNATLVLLCRDPKKATDGILPKTSDKIHIRQLDQTSLDSVRSVARSIADDVKAGRLPLISLLALTSGVQITGSNQPHVLPNGYEEQVTVNYLSHVLLVHELLGSCRPDARVLVVTSDVHRPVDKFFNTRYKPLPEMLRAEQGSEPKSECIPRGRFRYGVSKLYLTMWSHELARHLATTQPGMTVILMDPGLMHTGLFRHFDPGMNRFVLNFATAYPSIGRMIFASSKTTMISTPNDSAATLVKLSFQPEYADKNKPAMGSIGQTGGAKYYDCKCKEWETGGAALDQDKCKDVWDATYQILGLQQAA